MRGTRIFVTGGGGGGGGVRHDGQKTVSAHGTNTYVRTHARTDRHNTNIHAQTDG